MIQKLISSNYDLKQWLKTLPPRKFGFLSFLKKEPYLTEQQIKNKLDFPEHRKKIEELKEEIKKITPASFKKMQQEARANKEAELKKFEEEKRRLLEVKEEIKNYIEDIKFEKLNMDKYYQEKMARTQKMEYIMILNIAMNQISIDLEEYQYYIYDVPKCLECSYDSYIAHLNRLIVSCNKVIIQNKEMTKNLKYYEDFCEFVDRLDDGILKEKTNV